MELDVIFMLVLVLVIFAFFVWEKFPPDVVALGSSAALLLVGILDTDEFLQVFSNSAPITIAMMFIISAALERTGVLQIVGTVLQKAAKGSVLRAMLVMMFFVMIASAFMNNTPIVILMTPVIISLASSLKIAPSRLLIPLSFSSIFGGTLTLVGTSTNILMSSVASQAGEPTIGMFEMTLPGLVFAAIGMIYMVFAGRFLLPDRYSLATLAAGQPLRQFIAEVRIPHGSVYIGKNVSEFPITKEESSIIDVVRANASLRFNLKDVTFKAGDKLVIETNAGQIVGLKEDGQLAFTKSIGDIEPITADKTVMMEASIGLRSRLIGRKLGSISLRQKYGIYVLAVHRNDKNLGRDYDNIQLRFADTLLLEGPAEGIKRLLEDGDVINLSEPQDRPIRRAKAPLAFAVIMGVMILAAFDIMPIAGLAVIGAVIVMMTGCVDPDEAFNAIDWRILFLIFGMLGLSMGMEKTGAAHVVVQSVMGVAETIGPIGILLAVYVLTSTLTEMVSNNAVAVLIGPIVIGLAYQLGYDPKPFIMAVMFAASASFATPIGYQTNTFVYGAGGYHFNDFIRVGLPLNIIFAIVAVVVIPMFFPFEGVNTE